MNNFANTMRWLLITNKSYFVKITAAYTLCYFLVMAACTGMFSAYRHPANAFDLQQTVPIISFLFIVLSGYVASSVTFGLKTKQQRSLYMMLPASGNKKFWARVLLAAVWGYAVSALAVCVADILQMLLSWIFSGTAGSVVATMCKSLDLSNILSCYNADCSPAVNAVLGTLSALSTAAWGFSAYMLGGFLFHKNPFIMTTLSWIVFWVVVCTVCVIFSANILSRYDNVYIEFWWNEKTTLLIASTVVSLLFTILNLWLSFRIHKRMTVICHGMLNI